MNLEFPETKSLKSKSDFGICFPGGGLRACVLTYGCISELINIINKIKYISAGSGSTWFIVQYIYFNNLIFFDKYLEPENCTLENLSILTNQEPSNNTFGKKIIKVNLASEIIDNLFHNPFDTQAVNENKNKNKNKINTWIDVVYDSFFKDYNVEPKYDLNLPYPLTNVALCYSGVYERSFPCVFTPDYMSIPIAYKKDNVELGGYHIQINECCKNHKIDQFVASGLSSSAYQGAFEVVLSNTYNDNMFQLFNPNTKEINHTNLVDFGLFNEMGINTLLRRNVKNIHINVYQECSIDGDFMYFADYFTGLFMGNSGSEKYGIFEHGLWDVVYNELLYKYKNGKPLTIYLTTNVLSNEYLQIEGYQNVNFLFHILSRTSNWFNALPNETKNYVNINIPNFPYIMSTTPKIDSILTYLLYNCIKYDITHSPEYIKFYNQI